MLLGHMARFTDLLPGQRTEDRLQVITFLQSTELRLVLVLINIAQYWYWLGPVLVTIGIG